MAIFRKNKMRARPPIIFETPGKIYLEGQAHDAQTLTPIINDTFSFQTAECKAKTGMFTLNNRMFNSAFGSGYYGISSSTAIDCNQGLYKSISIKEGSDSITVPPVIYETTGNSHIRAIDNVTGNVTSKSSSPVSSSNTGIAYVINENATQLMVWLAGVASSDNTNRFASYFVYDKATGAQVGTPYTGTHATSNMSRQHIVRDAGNFFDTLTITGSSNTLTMSWTLTSFSKVNSTPLSTFNVTMTGNNSSSNGPAYMPSKSFAYPGGKQRIFMPLINSVSGGTLFKFATLTYSDASNRVAGDLANSVIVPTGSESMPGVTSNTFNYVYNTITREDQDYIYLTVVSSFENMAKNSTTDPLYATWLHTYKLAKSNLDAIEYVRSVEVSSTANNLGVLPTDTTADFLVVPVKNEQIAFLAWDNTNGGYVVRSRVPMIPNLISVDQEGRIWVTTDNNDNLHMFGPSVANSVSITMQANNANYVGAAINTNLVVNALNFKGQRVANNVTLIVNSLNATFEDGSTKKTLTTNVDSDLMVPIKITGAGKVQVLANLAL